MRPNFLSDIVFFGERSELENKECSCGAEAIRKWKYSVVRPLLLAEGVKQKWKYLGVLLFSFWGNSGRARFF